VELRCAGGAVLRAHSQVLLARCKFFRSKQSSGLGHEEEVDLPGHTAATMACVLQFLYTGRASLQQGKGDAAAQRSVQAAPPASNASGGAEGQAHTTGPSTPADLLVTGQHLRTVPYFQGLSEHDPVLLVPLLMVAADQLQLPDLHEACLQLAQRQLSPRTALPWLLAAHMGKLEALQKAAFEYVAANYAGKGEGEAGSNHGRPCRQPIMLKAKCCCCWHLLLSSLTPATCTTSVCTRLPCTESVEQSPVPVEAIAQHAPMVAAALMRAVAAGEGSNAKRPRLA
jgi:hypothetical protein